MRRLLVFAFGIASYALFLATFLYAVGWVGNLVVPRTIDSAAAGPLWTALLINTGLLLVFAVQHSVMARPGFKRWWTRFVPQPMERSTYVLFSSLALLLLVFAVQHSVMARPGFKRWWTRFVPQPMERSTYVLFSSLALLLLFWQWQPMGGIVWDVQSPAGRAVLYGLFAFGWLTVLVTTFLINHFDLFGLRQVWLYLRGKPYTHLRFATPGPYRHVRHPLYVGWLTAFWATPTMSVAHLLFAVATTAYILIAIRYEERDLVDFHGEAYADYRRSVPMLVPGLVRKRTPQQPAGTTAASRVAS